MRVYSWAVMIYFLQCYNVTFIYFLYFLIFSVLRFLNMQVKEIFSSYFDTGAVDRINFDTEIVEGLQACKCFFLYEILSTNID